jgi:Flp pilus assembly protein TadG
MIAAITWPLCVVIVAAIAGYVADRHLQRMAATASDAVLIASRAAAQDAKATADAAQRAADEWGMKLNDDLNVLKSALLSR